MAQAATAVVDDNSPLIEYQGAWSTGGTWPEFAASTTWGTAPNSTATFRFNGTSVSVYGTYAQGKNSLEFSLDDEATGSFMPPPNLGGAVNRNRALWMSPRLSDGPHKLVITHQPDSQVSRDAIWLDYILYSPSSDPKLFPPADARVQHLIDNGDPRIIYDDGWKREACSDTCILGSAHTTSWKGSKLTLTFQGTRISAFGNLKLAKGQTFLQAPIVKINDGASPGLSPNLDSNPSHNRTMGQLLFRSNVLPFGTHTLTIEQQGGDPIWLDYFLVKPGTADDVAAYRAAHPVKTNLAADSERSTMPKGAVLGVVIGAVVGVACILLLFFFVRRRRERKQDVNHIRPFSISMSSDTESVMPLERAYVPSRPYPRSPASARRLPPLIIIPPTPPPYSPIDPSVTTPTTARTPRKA